MKIRRKGTICQKDDLLKMTQIITKYEFRSYICTVTA